jgi:aromatic-L-amino-acid decarboxylase
VTRPSFALTVFRLLPTSINTIQAAQAGEVDIVNDINREFYSDLQSCSSPVLTQTLIGEVFCVRFAVGASRTDRGDWGNRFEKRRLLLRAMNGMA